ncbi:glucose-1-phosphate adenylyltransferase [Acetonema longum]|nr:glucose-1-phosphate adenylyltransferase [Acetonema longum]
MPAKKCVAMLLAGGQGSRLGALTKNLAKPAIPFGGKYRIIDFTLSNCYNSGIDTVGVLTQYRPFVLNQYIGVGSAWGLDRKYGGVFLLPPYLREKGGDWYSGTADAIYQNINFLDMHDPCYVLVLSGDHVYKMDYSQLLEYHREKQADVTISVLEVPWEDTIRFGIMNTAGDGRITEFEEKPKNAHSNLASMGVYVFSWPALRRCLREDAQNPTSSHDFGKNIIPSLLKAGKRLYAYRFQGYWKDVGTIESYWEANMDLLSDQPQFDIRDDSWRICSFNSGQPPHYIAPGAEVTGSIVGEGCQIFGQVEQSVIFANVYIETGARVRRSIILSDVYIGKDVEIDRSVIGEKVQIEAGRKIGLLSPGSREITVIGQSFAHREQEDCEEL